MENGSRQLAGERVRLHRDMQDTLESHAGAVHTGGSGSGVSRPL